MRIVPLIFAQTGVCQTCNMQTILCYCVMISNKFKVFPTIWMTVRERLVCVLHVQHVKPSCRIEFAQSQTSFLQASSWIKWTDLDTRIFVSHWAVVYRKNCPRAYRRPDWLSLFRSTCDVCVTSGYRSTVNYTRQQWSRFCSSAPKHGRWKREVCTHFQCLEIAVFVVLVKNGGRIVLVTEMVGIIYWIPESSF